MTKKALKRGLLKFNKHLLVEERNEYKKASYIN